MLPKCVRDVLEVDRQGVLLRRTFRDLSTSGARRELTPFQQVDSMRYVLRETQDEIRSLLENALYSVVKVEKEEEATKTGAKEGGGGKAKKAGVKEGGGGSKAQGTVAQGTRKQLWQHSEAVEVSRRANLRPKREVGNGAGGGGGETGGGGGGGGEGAGATAAVKGRRAAQGTKKCKTLKTATWTRRRVEVGGQRGKKSRRSRAAAVVAWGGG